MVADYGTRVDRLPKAVVEAARSGSGDVVLLGESAYVTVCDAVFGTMPAYGTYVDWDRMRGSGTYAYLDEPDAARRVVEVIRAESGLGDVVLLSNSPTVPAVRLPVEFAVENMLEIVRSFAECWFYAPSSGLLVLCDMGEVHHAFVHDGDAGSAASGGSGPAEASGSP